MKSRPILFSPPMSSAIRVGTKTQTRRAINPQPNVTPDLEAYVAQAWATGFVDVACPYGEPGDRLWVRETHYRFGHWEPIPGARTKAGRQKWAFVADSEELLFDPPAGHVVRLGRHHKDPSTPAWHRRLARFMPRAFSRITLDVIAVRVERLRAITEADAMAEGVEREANPERWRDYTPERESVPLSFPNACDSFFSLWESINGTASLAANPWVWVITFERVPA